MNIKLQIALDDLSLEESLEMIEKVKDNIDIVEVGTPFIMQYGMEPVRQIKKSYPELEVLCDMKIMDAGGYEAELALKAGADYVTVLGVTDDLTIRDCVQMAKKYNAKVLVDMICVHDFASRISVLETLGVDIIAVHTGVDQQATGRTPLEDLRDISNNVKKTSVAVAGGISLETINDYLKYNPEIIIIGSGITKSENPTVTAEKIANVLKYGVI